MPNSASEMSQYGVVFKKLSALDGWSLVTVGGISLIVSSIATAWAGVLVSLAVALHGAIELFLRKRALEGGQSGAVRRMALNQLGLAISLSLYFGYQVIILDDNAVYETLMTLPLSNALLLYPEPMRSQLIDSLPLLVRFFYAIAAGVSWLVCGATAIYYWSQPCRTGR